MQPLVSITVPARNVEPFLRDSLDCVVNQTFRDFEVICVDDQSTDGTLGIFEEYAARDARFKVFTHAVSQGQAATRNEIFGLVSGQYIGFVDGDDLLDRDLFRKAYECAEKNQSDLVLWDYVSFTREAELKRKRRRGSALLSVSPADKVALLKWPAFLWITLIRTDVARALGISFSKGRTRSDIPVHWQLITQLERIAILPERLYYYRQHPLAATHRNDWSRTDLILMYDKVKEYLARSDLYGQYRDTFLSAQLRSLCNIHDNMSKSDKPRVLEMIVDRLGDEEWQYINGANQLPRHVLDFYAALRGAVPAKIRRALRFSARDLYRSLGSPFTSLRLTRR